MISRSMTWEVVMEQSVGNVEGMGFYIRVASRREELWLLRLRNCGRDGKRNRNYEMRRM
jgi:hypothetical protein